MPQFAVFNVNQSGKLVMKVVNAHDTKEAVRNRAAELPGLEHRIILVSNAFPSAWGTGGVQLHKTTVHRAIPRPPLEIKIGGYVSQDDLERHMGKSLGTADESGLPLDYQ